MSVCKSEWRRVVLAVAVAATGLNAGLAASAADPVKDPAASRYLAGRLVDTARQLLRNSNLSPDTAAKQAAILLQYAQNLDATDLRTLKLLAEAAHAADKPALRKNALHQLISLDNGDLVAQVQYLDLLASASEMLDERAAVYQNALDQASFNPQVRSEMALRLAQIAVERGDPESARQWINRSLKLNDLNLGALRLQVSLVAQDPHAVPEKGTALVSLLMANPFQPDAWMELARICETANLHERAADYLVTAIEQLQLQGIAVSGELYQEVATQEAIAGRRAESFQIIGNLAKLPDAPLSALLVAEILAAADVPGSAAVRSDVQSLKDQIAQGIEKRLADLVKDAESEGKISLFADAAGVQLSIMPDISPETTKWIDDYAAHVESDDPTLARLRGWQLYRTGKLDEAKAVFEKDAGGDPMAQVGLARILIDQKKKDDAARQLQDVWTSHPTGLLALQVSDAARRGGITLTDTSLTRQLREIAAGLPNTIVTAHRAPRELELVSPNVRKPAVGLGESIILNLRITNATDRPMPVGPDAMVVTNVGVSGVTRAVPPVQLGIFAIEDLQRTYRLEPHAVIDGTIRLDQGLLSDLCERTPTKTLAFGIKITTAPRVDTSPGLGGLSLSTDDIQRGGLTFKTPDDLNQLTHDISGVVGTLEKQLVRIGVAGALLKYGKEAPANALESQDTTRTALIAALQPLVNSDKPLVRAALMRAAPTDGGPAFNQAIDGLANDPDPIVRVLWTARQEEIASQPDDAGKTALKVLQERASGEKDESVKEYMTLATNQAKFVATPPPPPATAAAPSPTTAPHP